ncbi:hypothetical protein N7G274_005757 [Stereocaulon virgatum]|uniref:Killer toxin Kp4 domain-containing protein n=1 Tax=Stereocaulon virgatum TaxID=373712 RepID=A0ABR4A6D2_9LECA
MFSSTCPSRPIVALLALLISTTHLIINPVQALGINCRGSWLCPSSLRLFPDYLTIISRIANGTLVCLPGSRFNCGPMSDTDIYAPGKHIVCLPQSNLWGGVCAFTQGNVDPLGTTGAVIKQKLVQLRAHGCRVCGSIPLSDDNDPDTKGILTVNWIGGHFGPVMPGGEICWGLCPPTHYSIPPPLNDTSMSTFDSNGLVLPSGSDSVFNA